MVPRLRLPLAHTLSYFLGREGLPGSDVSLGSRKLLKEVQPVNQLFDVNLIW
jgi:hypothetical protein